MNEQTRALFASILALPPEERDALMDALNQAEDQAFVAELQRRRTEVLNGTADTVPASAIWDEE